ncbi:anti-sigma factor domain-containing protein [Sporosarcina cyprini]|uniref:anti-sigma factor domain-containing protein n=1 Tax=Sporosarcina cyprini TaxID=2910523 RepID=UPI001EDD655B|nr:anti-sigma factor [Sporosarcina cyprini]MCG3088948.1 anti-sigma factor [Sporosarcina cyprini]
MRRDCDYLIPYIANELKESENVAFEEHMKNCAECQKEYKELAKAWNALPFEYKEIDVPESLKGEVLGFVFEHDKGSSEEAFMAKIRKLFVLFKSQFTPVSTSILAILLLAIVGLGIANVQERGHQAQNNPIEIVATIPIKSANQSHSGPTGIAYIVQQGSEKKLILQVHELSGVEGSQVYQVWLLKNGLRENGGIFKPDENGSGVLTYQLAEGQTFDQIGITVEPDSNSTQPRGEKVAGS